MQILNTLEERHKYNVVHPRWDTSTQQLSVLLLLYRPIKWRDTTCNNPTALPLHSLIVSLTQSQRLFYNATIQYIVVLQCFPFIGELPWENTTGHPIQRVHKMLENKHPKNLFRGCFPRILTKGPLAARPSWGEDVSLNPLARKK